MKNFKKVLALVLAVVMLLSFATVASAVTSDYYKDTDDIDYAEAVDVLGTIGVLNGFPDDTFRPDATITRAQSAKIIAMFDNGSTDINKLYTAANPFSDCVDHWAESYIAYGVKTGILAGYASGKFLPEENVTGVQFLKMALVVLGYDAKVEGLEGKNWDVNTLALAKRVGLTATLGNKFDYSADLKRQEAAVIMLDALRAETVEYGSTLGVNLSKLESELAKWDPTDPFAGVNVNGIVYMTVAGAVKTGELLGKQWGLKESTANDPFMRPLRTWELNGKVVGTYMFPVSAEYKTAATMCDVLVDLGVAKDNTYTARKVGEHYVNGVKAVYENQEGTHSHNIETGYDTYCNEKANVIGAQGTLTQIFNMGDGTFRITEIDTWLGTVTAAKKTSGNRDGHLTSYTLSTVEVYNEHLEMLRGDDAPNTLVTDTDGLSKGDKVILYYSALTDTAYNVTVAKGVAGKLDGFKGINYPSQTRIDGEYKNDAEHFHLGYYDSKDQTKFGAKTFYFDFYGNVIGMTDPTDDTTWDYLVINKAGLDHVELDAVCYANVVGLDAQMKKLVTVASINGETAADMADWFYTGNVFGHVNTHLYHKLFAYALNANDEYVIVDANYVAFTNILIEKGEPIVTANGEAVFATNAATKYLIEENDGSYTAVTGFRSIDSLTAANAQVVDENNDGIAEVVYIYGSIVRDGDKLVAYVTRPATEWIEQYEGVPFYKMIVYVDGVATEIYVKGSDAVAYFGDRFVAGFYEFKNLTVGKNSFVEVSKDWDELEINTIYYIDGISGDVVQYEDLVNDGYYYDAVAADITYYSVRVDGTVVKEDAKYAETYLVDSFVQLRFNAAGEIAAVYVIEGYDY